MILYNLLVNKQRNSEENEETPIVVGTLNYIESFYEYKFVVIFIALELFNRWKVLVCTRFFWLQCLIFRHTIQTPFILVLKKNIQAQVTLISIMIMQLYNFSPPSCIKFRAFSNPSVITENRSQIALKLHPVYTSQSNSVFTHSLKRTLSRKRTRPLLKMNIGFFFVYAFS